MQLMPLVTLWPLLAQFQHTVSPSVMEIMFGTNARPWPTVTSNNRGPGLSHGVGRERGVGVGLAGAVRAEVSRATPVARNKSKQRKVRNRTLTNVLFGFVDIKLALSGLKQY